MRVLLDTHALVWALAEPDRLSPRARVALVDPATVPLNEEGIAQADCAGPHDTWHEAEACTEILCPPSPPVRVGDCNCDDLVDFNDIDPFVLAIGGPADYEASFPTCRWLNADCNCDGNVDFGDIDPFVECLSGPCQCP